MVESFFRWNFNKEKTVLCMGKLDGENEQGIFIYING